MKRDLTPARKTPSESASGARLCCSIASKTRSHENSGRSYGVQGSWAPSDLSWNFYGGIHEKFEVMANLVNPSKRTTRHRTPRLGRRANYARLRPKE